MNKDPVQEQKSPQEPSKKKDKPDVIDGSNIGDVKEFIVSASKKLIKVLKIDRNNIVATADISAWRSLDREIGALIIEKVLQEKFAIHLPPDMLVRLKAGKYVELEEPSSDKRLPPRTVEISLAPQDKIFSVKGCAPKNGEDGYSVLGFDWKRRPGHFDSSGHVDLKKLNIYPTIEQDGVLATIYLATPGDPGVACFGKMIRQDSGNALRVKWNERVVEKFDIPGSPDFFQLKARNNGIVNFALLRKNDPKSLMKVDVAEKITILGDVNYGVGDLGKIDDEDVECPASLVVNGRVKGAFSLQSNGFIHVKDSIEGKSVIAREVKAGFIANGCKVEASELVEAGVIANAFINAQKIVVTKTSNNSELFAREEISFSKGATALSLKMTTQHAEFKKVVFSGGNEIVMGEYVFNVLRKNLKAMRAKAEKTEEYMSSLKPLATSILTDLGRVQEFLKKSGSKASQSIKEEFVALKSETIKLLNATEEISNKEARERFYHFQAKLGEHNFHESILLKIESMAKNTKKYLELQADFLKISKDATDAEELIEHLKNEISTNMFLSFEDCTFHGVTAEIIVKCGQTEKIISGDQVPKGPFKVQYKPLSELEDLGKINQGKLRLKEITS